MSNGKVLPMRRVFEKGDLIFRQGDDGNCAYIIEKGRVEVFVEEGGVETPISRLEVGEIFGEMAIIDSTPRSASVRALEDCRLSLVSQDQLSSRLSEADAVVRLLVNMLLKRIRVGLNEKSVQKNVGLVTQTKLQKKRRNEDKIAIERIRFERELEDAFENNELFVHYQPIVKMASGDLAGFEALIRWESPTKGMVRPDVFMGVAEEGALVVSIGRWVLQKAIEDLSIINNFLNFKPFMAINVSGKQIGDPLFFKTLEESSKRADCDLGQIKLEITERVLVEGQVVMEWIRCCQKMGVTVALDDFGTGYSSLSSLTRLKVDNFKIDKSFIDRLSQERESIVVVRGLIDIAKGLGIPVVAEGIETNEQDRLLTALGCTYGQGYIYSKPLPLEGILEFCGHPLASSSKKVA